MLDIGCPSCKYGVTTILAAETVGTRTDIVRRCTSCGATLRTYRVAEPAPPPGDKKPPVIPFTPDQVSPLRDEAGNLPESPKYGLPREQEGE